MLRAPKYTVNLSGSNTNNLTLDYPNHDNVAEATTNVANELSRVADILKLQLQFQITTMEKITDDLIKEYIKKIEIALNEV